MTPEEQACYDALRAERDALAIANTELRDAVRNLALSGKQARDDATRAEDERDALLEILDHIASGNVDNPVAFAKAAQGVALTFIGGEASAKLLRLLVVGHARGET